LPTVWSNIGFDKGQIDASEDQIKNNFLKFGDLACIPRLLRYFLRKEGML
jgi:hypothetical protein